MDNEETRLRPWEHNFCFQDETIEELKATMGTMERTLSDSERTTKETLERLEAKMDRLTDKIDNGGLTVAIKADGILANMKLVDVIQVLWDSPSTTIKTAESTLKRVVEVCKAIAWIFGAILVLMYTIINIFHLPTP